MMGDLLRCISEGQLGHEIVAAAADGPEMAEAVGRLRPDLLLLDLQLPGLDNFRLVEAVRIASPGTRIVILAPRCDRYTVYRVEQLEVHGFLDKRDSTLESLRQALHAVSEGRPHFSEAFWREKATRGADPFAFDKVLSDREQIVLALIGEAFSDQQIAQRLELSPHTIEKHRSNIRRKLNLRNRGELARDANENGFRSFLAEAR